MEEQKQFDILNHIKNGMELSEEIKYNESEVKEFLDEVKGTEVEDRVRKNLNTLTSMYSLPMKEVASSLITVHNAISNIVIYEHISDEDAKIIYLGITRSISLSFILNLIKIFKIDNEELKGITDKAIKYSKENEEKEWVCG